MSVKAWACIVAVTCLALQATPGVAQRRATAPVRGPVQFARQPAAGRSSLARLPAVLPGPALDPGIAKRINAALAREDSLVDGAARDCRASFREAQGKASPDAWTRGAEVAMAGPRFLAIAISDSYYCGGPYPNDDLRSAFVYDLATGRPVDWLKLFPAGARARLDTAGDGATLGLVAWPELTRRAAAQAGAECRPVFESDDYAGFTVLLDARTGALVARPAQFPHALQACAEDVRLGIADLRRLGFAADLVAALDAAHRLQGTRASDAVRR